MCAFNSRRSGFLVTVIRAKHSLLANWTPALRRQNHTTSPSASAPFVKSAAASTASGPNVRDDGQRPSLEGPDDGLYKVICDF
jgi:hypothetical protein